MSKCSQENNRSGRKATASVSQSDLRARLRKSPTFASVKQNNSPFLLGVNTKQLSNQMLELTKVINELKDVLIQQVNTSNSSSEAT